jgi:hypothetical protein
MHSAFSRLLNSHSPLLFHVFRFLSRADHQVVAQSSLPDAPKPSQKEILLSMPKDILHGSVAIRG